MLEHTFTTVALHSSSELATTVIDTYGKWSAEPDPKSFDENAAINVAEARLLSFSSRSKVFAPQPWLSRARTLFWCFTLFSRDLSPDIDVEGGKSVKFLFTTKTGKYRESSVIAYYFVVHGKSENVSDHL